jgi:NADH dehydrogenase (ubiquinone) 1 alpha subcomplex subunit 5
LERPIGDWQQEALTSEIAAALPREFPLCGSNNYQHTIGTPPDYPTKMRATFRLLAAVRPAARFLEPGTPTGLTGLTTHASPRSTLLYLYTSTLEKLKAVPDHSVYRQSVEALTKHRMALVEGVLPPGYDEWSERAQKLVSEHPGEFAVAQKDDVGGAKAIKLDRGGHAFVVHQIPVKRDMRYEEWDGEQDEGPELEGSRTIEEKEDLKHIFERRDIADVQQQVEWEPEPQLTADQWVYQIL